MINSNAKEDHCGVCRGDASTCETIKDQYNETQGLGKTIVVCVEEMVRPLSTCETIKDQYNETQGLGKTIVVFVEEMRPLVKQSKTNIMKHRD